MSDETLAYWQAEARYWREIARRLGTALAEIERAADMARGRHGDPPEPPLGSRAKTDRAVFVRGADGWECPTPDCPNCPCDWFEVCNWGGAGSDVEVTPAWSHAP